MWKFEFSFYQTQTFLVNVKRVFLIVWMVIYEVICENIIHMYMHICMSIFSWRTKSYKIWIQESKLWWWCHAKTNTCPMIWLWSPDWSWYSPMAWNDQKCTSYLLVCFLYCCLQHINETTIFLISILLWWHFFMMYVIVYISFLILNKVFFLIAEWATICDILWLMEL